MNEIFQDLKARLITARDTLATEKQLNLLRDEVVVLDGVLTADEFCELDELLTQAYCAANASAIGQQKPRHDL